LALTKVGGKAAVLASGTLFIALLPVGSRQCLVEHLGQHIEDRLMRLLWEMFPKIL
jgi:hypothetical protein